MKLGIFAKTFAGANPLEVLSRARQTGYEAVQYNMICSGLSALPETIETAVADAVLEACEATGIEIAAVSATYNMIHPDQITRAKGRRSFAAIAAAAHRMGTRLLTVCTGSRDADDQWRHHPGNAGPEAWQDMCNEFRLLIAIAEKYDVMIGVEPESANVVDSAPRARQLIDELGSSRIRIVLDPANLFEVATSEHCKTLIQSAVELLVDRIELAHAKDRFADGRFAPAGDGVVDFAHFLGTLRRAGFSGSLITHGLRDQDASRVAELLRSKLAGLDHNP